MKQLFAPHITEKTYATIATDAKGASTYTFKVHESVDKADVKRLVEKEYKVTVVDVRMVNLPGKTRRFKGVKGQTSARRKAIVRLKAGQKIAAFDIEDAKAEDKE
jgi:large subunit ribosomal protein L23